MKKILFFFAFLLMVGATAQAQTEGKSCAKKCDKSAKACTKSADTKVAAALTEAEIAADADETIQVRECAMSGAKSYYQKSVWASSGSVSWSEVEYCNKSKAFKQVAAASVERTVQEAAEAVPAETSKKSCSKTCAKTCASKKKAN